MERSIIDLKSELLRKKEDLDRKKFHQGNGILNSTYSNTGDEYSMYVKYSKIKSKQKEKKSEKIKGKKTFEDVDKQEEENKLNLSKISLEKKSRLYDKLIATVPSDETNEQYMVNFQRKTLIEIKEIPANRLDSSIIQPINAPQAKPQIDYVNFPQNYETKNESNQTLAPEQKTLPEYKNQNVEQYSDTVHFQELFGDEARELGVGYYKFSTDESERRRQMAELQARHEHTQAARERVRAQRLARTQLVAERLRKVARRLKPLLGKTDEEMSELVQKALDLYTTPAPTLAQDGDGLDRAGDSFIDQELREKEVQERLKYQELKDENPRIWDEGKSGVDPPRLMNQKKWVEKQREERNPDFAPPSQYFQFTSATSYRKPAFPSYKVHPRSQLINEIKKAAPNT